MKKTIAVLIAISLICFAFATIPVAKSSETQLATITICLDADCWSLSSNWTAQLYYYSSGTYTGLSCTLSAPSLLCCQVDASGLTAGNFYWQISSNPSGYTCLGTSFYYNPSSGGNYTYYLDCANCTSANKKKK